MILLKYAIRELKNHWRFTLTFVLNLSIGLIGYLALTGFQDSLSNFLSERSLTLLGADISASARRPFSDEEVLKMQNVLGSENQTSKGLSLYTMAKGPARSRLISLKVFDEKFPFYGEIKLEDGKVYTSQDSKIFHGEDPKTNGGRRKVWIFPELQAQLGIKVGQSLKIGEAEFEVSGVVISDSTEVSSAASLAPKVYMSLFDIEKTGLLGFGSSASHLLFFKIPDRDLAAKKVEEIYQILDDPSVRVQDYKSASQQVNRGLGYLTDYLGLVVLVGLSLAAVGAGFLFQSFLSRRLKEIAILRSLGLSANKSVVIFGIEIVLMGLLSVLPAIVFTQLVFPLISEWIQELFSFPLKVSLSLGSVVTVACVATLGSLLICLPQLMALKALKPKDIFEDPERLVLPPLKERLLSFLPFIVGFYFLAFSEVKSFYIAAGFVLGLLSSIGLLFVMGNFLIHLMGRITSNITSQVSRPRFWIRFAFLNLSRRSFSTGLSISALGLGCLLINLIPQVRASLQGELVPGSGTKLPSFFLFDIQDDQAEELKALAFQNGFQVESLSPNVRSRLTHLNGEEIEKASFSKKAFTREEEQSARSRNRGFNLSYREELHPSETITKGKELSQELSSDGVAEISVEREFAKRLEWNVGDLVTFDIQGIPVEAKIVNLRKVKWTAFVPNFFILFQGGVLDDAPKTFLATIPQLPNDEKKFAVQEIIVDRLPNVSIVDVTRTVSMILDVMSSMTQILTIMAWLSVLAGLFVLAAIFLRLASVRKGDFNLVRVLGGSARFQGKSIAMELVALSFLAAVIGVLLSWVLGFLVVEMIFEIPFAVDLAFNALSVFSVTAIGLTIGWFTMGRLLKVTPREVFQGVD